MPKYKVWSADRKQRFFIVASSLHELKLKGSAELKLQQPDCDIVDDTNGKIVDDDEMLSGMFDRDLVVTPRGGQWASSSTEKSLLKISATMGKLPLTMTQSEYYILRQILAKPQLQANCVDGFVGKVMPYLLQRIKMRGCWVLQPDQIVSMINTTYSNEERHRHESTYQQTSSTPVSRLDCLTGLLNSVDEIVAHDLLMVMSQFPVALPLAIRCLGTDHHYTLMTSLLRGISVKWEIQVNEGGDRRVVEHCLFHNPFRMVVAVRLGDSDVGKSSILNKVMSNDNMFSSAEEPGCEFGKSASADGSVEFVWLTEETCNQRMWNSIGEFYSSNKNEVLLLANLHGNAACHSQLVDILSDHFQCHFLVFRMPDSDNDWKQFLRNNIAKHNTTVIYVDNGDPGDQACIKTNALHRDATIRKLRDAIKIAFYSCNTKFDFVCYSIATESPATAPLIATPPSQDIIDFVKRNTCSVVRHAMELQIKRPETPEETKQIMTSNKRSNDILSLMTQLFMLPDEQLQRAAIHLETELSCISNEESQTARSAVIRAMSIGEKDQKLQEAEFCNLGLEHFIREMSCVHKYNYITRENPQILNIPDHIAQLFIAGHALELLDGDAGDIQMNWFNAVCRAVSILFPNLRVYTISIIGLQSSGKSTLLNSLFACRFAVSVGRCSRGLFMRLLFLEDELVNRLNCDAFLLIDSEGLRAPENMDYRDGTKKDNLLAAFAMGVSNLSIINVFGEVLTDMTGILQIAIVTMARLEQADLKPDILMVQHLHTPDVSRTQDAQLNFSKAIDAAVKLINEEVFEAGIKNRKCVDVLNERMDDGTLLSQFHAYKDGATANSPPSKAYHDDVVKLYEKILSSCQSSKTILQFTTWQTLVENYWDSVKEEDFSLTFSDIAEMCEVMKRDREVEFIKHSITAAYSHHASIIEQKLRNDVNAESQLKDDIKLKRKLTKSMSEDLTCVLNRCKEKTCLCQDAINNQAEMFNKAKGKSWENDVKSALSKFIARVYESHEFNLSRIIEESILIRGFSSQFDDIITRRMKIILSGEESGKQDEQQRRRIADDIIGELKRFAATHDNDKPVRDEIESEIAQVYRQIPDMVQKFRQPESKFKEIFQVLNEPIAGSMAEQNMLSHADCSLGDELMNLNSTLETLAESIPGDRYAFGMVGQLRTAIDNTIHDMWCNVPNISDVECAIHVLVLQLFCKRMENLQIAWNDKNTASSFLNKNEMSYRQAIDTRLEYGFSSNYEGQIIVNKLLEAIAVVAVTEEHQERTRAVLGRSTEQVRLAFFAGLVREVQAGNRRRAIRYFTGSGKGFEDWFKIKVDKDYLNYSGTGIRGRYGLEFNKAYALVKEAANARQLVTNVTSYWSRAGIYVTLNVESFKLTEDDFKELQKSILKALNDKKSEEINKDRTSFLTVPSKNTQINLKTSMGCMERCRWCGVMCWRHFGHDDNDSDVDNKTQTGKMSVREKPSECESRRHYAPHQPCGLKGVYYKPSNTLSAISCSEKGDNDIVYFSKFKKCGIKWKKATALHLKNVWSFGRHYVPEIDRLMRWFFMKLHEDLAKHYDFLPATEKDLEKHKCTKLNGLAILARLEAELRANKNSRLGSGKPPR